MSTDFQNPRASARGAVNCPHEMYPLFTSTEVCLCADKRHGGRP